MIKPVVFLFAFLAILFLPFRFDPLFIPCTSLAQSNEHPISYTHWEMVWEDNFDDSILNTTKWNVVDWAAEKNNELEYYTPNNISLSNGNLCIISKKMDYNGRAYTSGAVETKDKFYFLYGKVEIRAILPIGKGIFPAFWMLPQEDISLPEIDIMEMIGNEPSEIWMVYHWLENGFYQRSYTSHSGPNYSEGYHIFSIEWSPDKLVWLIDDIERFSTHHSPNQPMFLYMNTAIGGDWPGAPDETTFSPQALLVDYVRIYQRKESY